MDKLICTILRILLFGGLGAVLASANIQIDNWRFWVILAIAVAIGVTNYVEGTFM